MNTPEPEPFEPDPEAITDDANPFRRLDRITNAVPFTRDDPGWPELSSEITRILNDAKKGEQT